MPGATGSTEAELAECDRDAVGGDAVARDSGAYPFRQWTGVCCPAAAGLAPRTGDQSPVYRARQSLGERVLRELQWEAEGGIPEWGDLLLVAGGPDRNRGVESSVQHGAAAHGSGLQAPGACLVDSRLHAVPQSL